jgi:hypothetical protein
MLVNGMQFVMCRLCAMNQVEEAAQRRARLVARAEIKEDHVWSGLTIHIFPPSSNPSYVILITFFFLRLATNRTAVNLARRIGDQL